MTTPKLVVPGIICDESIWFTTLTSSRGAVTPHTVSASLTVTIITGCACDAFFGGPNRRPPFGVIEKPL
jgi:hypothetical protein